MGQILGRTPYFGVRWPKYQYFWLCEAAAHVMEDQSGFQGYKTFHFFITHFFGFFVKIFKHLTRILESWFV